MAALLAVAPQAGASRAGQTTPTTAAPVATTPATVPVAAPTPPPGPGGTVAWRPEGRNTVGRQLVHRGNVNGVEVAWIDPQLTRPVFVPGTGDPGGPWAWLAAPLLR